MSAKRSGSHYHSMDSAKRTAASVENLEDLEKVLKFAKQNEAEYLKEFNARQHTLRRIAMGRSSPNIIEDMEGERQHLININNIENSSQDHVLAQIRSLHAKISAREERINSLKVNTAGEVQDERTKALEIEMFHDTRTIGKLTSEHEQSMHRGRLNYNSIKELEAQITQYVHTTNQSDAIAKGMQDTRRIIREYEDKIREAKEKHLTGKRHFDAASAGSHSPFASGWAHTLNHPPRAAGGSMKGGSQLAPHERILTGGSGSSYHLGAAVGGGGRYGDGDGHQLPPMISPSVRSFSPLTANTTTTTTSPGRGGHISPPDVNYDDLFDD
jgi:hypothetical protein